MTRRRALLGNYAGEDPFNKDYVAVNYIWLKGGQYINTGIYPNGNTQTTANITVAVTNQNLCVFGCIFIVGGSYYWLACYNNAWSIGGYKSLSDNNGSYSPIAGTHYTIVFNDDQHRVLVNGDTIKEGMSFGTTDEYPLIINGRRSSASAMAYLTGNFKYEAFSIKDTSTGTYLRNFIPCYRKSDGIAGMYDTVTNSFYGNDGTGTIEYG